MKEVLLLLVLSILAGVLEGYDLPICSSEIESLDVLQCDDGNATIHVSCDNAVRIKHFHGEVLIEEITDTQDSNLNKFFFLSSIVVQNVTAKSRFVLEGVDSGFIGALIASVECGDQIIQTKGDTNAIPKAGKFFIEKGNEVDKVPGFQRRTPTHIYSNATVTYSQGPTCNKPSATGIAGQSFKIYGTGKDQPISICEVELFEDEEMTIPITLSNPVSSSPTADGNLAMDGNPETCWTVPTNETLLFSFGTGSTTVKAVRVRFGQERAPIFKTFFAIDEKEFYRVMDDFEQLDFLVNDDLCAIDGVYYPIISYPVGGGDPSWRGFTPQSHPILEGAYWVWDSAQGHFATHSLDFVLDLSCRIESTAKNDLEDNGGLVGDGNMILFIAAGAGGFMFVTLGGATVYVIQRRRTNSKDGGGPATKVKSDRKKIDSFTAPQDAVVVPEALSYKGSVYAPFYGEDPNEVNYADLPDV